MKFYQMKLVVLVLLVADIFGAVEFSQTGMKSFDDWNPDKTGSKVVTNVLREAIEWCRLNDKTLYIAPGTYLVDSTIWVKGADNSEPKQPGFSYIHGDAYNRPIIKLKDGTFASITDPANALPVFQLRHIDSTKNSPWIYWNMLQHIVFDLGNNPGATAIEWDAAQDSRVNNIKVRGQNFLVGIKGLPGANQSNLDIEVVGGQYGIFLKDAAGVNLTGIRLRNQLKNALVLKNYRATTIVGLKVENCGGPAIFARGGDYDQGVFTLDDADIQINNANHAVFDINDRPIVAHNLYIKGTTKVVAGIRPVALTAPAELAHIQKLIWAPSQVNDHPAYTYIKGDKKEDNEIFVWEPATKVPDKLLSQHLPDGIYAFNHPEAVNALTFPGTSVADKIQAAINSSHKVIYVPAGSHSINKTLLLKAGKILLGDPGKRTFLNPTYSFLVQRYVVETENTIGWVGIQDLYFGTKDRQFDGAVHWQTSNGFMLNVRASLDNGIMEYENQNYRFSQNAGGKFYGITDHRNVLDVTNAPASSKFRKVVVEETSHPITFYGMNLERGGVQRKKVAPPFLEIINAENVRILGWKCEPDLGAALRLQNASNIKVNSMLTHRITDFPLIELSGTTSQIEINLMGTKQSTLGEPMVLPYQDILKNHLLVHFTKGDFDNSVFNDTTDTVITPPVEPVPVKKPNSTSRSNVRMNSPAYFDILGRLSNETHF